MAYVSDSNLTQFWGLAKDYIKAENSRYANWQKTEKAGAVTCYPVGDTPLLPTVDFMFTETPPASGDKGPENPSTITGVQEVKLFHSNSNMLCLPYYDSQRNYGSGALTMTANADGSVSVSGKHSSNGTLRLLATYPSSFGLPVKDGLTYYNTSKGDTYQPQLRFYNDKTTNVAKFVSAGSSWLYNLGDSTTTVAIVYPANLDLTATTAIIFPSLSIVPYNGPWEQPETVVHTVDLGSTYYGGTVDLATGVMTVTHQAVTPNTEIVDISSAPAALPLDYADTYGRTITSADGTSLVVGSTGGTVVYKLATPQTVQLTPAEILSLTQADKYTPRLNTIYTDASSVQVGYVKSPIRSEYELTQAIIATEGGE